MTYRLTIKTASDTTTVIDGIGDPTDRINAAYDHGNALGVTVMVVS